MQVSNILRYQSETQQYVIFFIKNVGFRSSTHPTVLSSSTLVPTLCVGMPWQTLCVNTRIAK